MSNNSTDYNATVDDDYEYDWCWDCVDATWQQKAADAIFLYIPPILIFLGTIGNIITLIVLQSRVYKKSPTVVALSALAVADILVLNTGLLRHWIRVVWDIEVRTDAGEALCKIHYGMTYISMAMSACILALTTIERTISVWFPFRVKDWVSKTRMIIITCVLVFFIVVLYIPVMVKVGLETPEFHEYPLCRLSSDDEKLRNIYYWLTFTVQFFLPMTIIIVGNILILVKLTAAARLRSEKMNTSDDSSKSTTVMLMLLGLLFVLTIFPANIYFIGYGYGAWKTDTEIQYAKVSFAYSCTNILTYVNSSTNFIMYCVSGTRFRKAVKIMFCRIKEAPIGSTTISTNYAVSTTSVSTVAK